MQANPPHDEDPRHKSQSYKDGCESEKYDRDDQYLWSAIRHAGRTRTDHLKRVLRLPDPEPTHEGFRPDQK